MVQVALRQDHEPHPLECGIRLVERRVPEGIEDQDADHGHDDPSPSACEAP